MSPTGHSTLTSSKDNDLREYKHLLILAAFGLLSLELSAAQLEGKVIAVADGDTLTVLDSANVQHRVRLAQIDAPEGGQAFGARSKELLSQLCFGQQARVTVETKDRYGRSVGDVQCNGVDANAELVRQGLAWVYILYAKPGSPLFALEDEARRAKRGLWSDPQAVPPWQWRRGSSSGARAPNTAAPTAGEVRGNRRSNVYHLPHCPSFDAVSESNRIIFGSEAEAINAGFRKAGNC